MAIESIKKMNKLNNLLKTKAMKKFMFLSVAMVFIALAANAQTDPSCAPVDGGLSLLLIAGAAGYGAKKIAERKSKKANNEN